MNLTARDFVGVTDLPMIAAFFDQKNALVGCDHAALHAGDVWWRFGQYEPELHQVRLWFVTEQLVGLGWVTFGSHLELHLHPHLENDVADNMAREIMDWATRLCSGEITCESIPENTRLIGLLESSGFVPDGSQMLMYTFDLTQPIPDVALPIGFEARHVLESEFAERVEAHRDAFAPSKFSFERYARVCSMSGYNQALDVVIARQQEIAAFCLVWLSNGVGCFEPVGTRAAHQRHGLGKLVMLEGLRRLKTLGAHSAVVNSKPKIQAFYESCGFRVINRFIGFRKP
jgi:ribosomal protein S18 acetylase RimI-like enzyme